MAAEHKNISKRQSVEDTRAENMALGVLNEKTEHLKNTAKRAYTDQKEKAIENEQITQFLPMVHKIVQRVVTYLKPPLSYEDLVSAGTVGLIKAAHDYDASRQAEFKTYAYIRIRGAILDELRNWSFVPANIDKQIREAMQLSVKIANQTGKTPTDEELAEKLKISVDKLYQTFESARAKHFVSIDSSQEDSLPLGSCLASKSTTTPAHRIEQTELVDKLTEAIQQLNERQRQIIILYYQQQLTMKQIAELFEITEPRVSQLHASAIFNLSVKLRQWKDGGQ